MVVSRSSNSVAVVGQERRLTTLMGEATSWRRTTPPSPPAAAAPAGGGASALGLSWRLSWPFCGTPAISSSETNSSSSSSSSETAGRMVTAPWMCSWSYEGGGGVPLGLAGLPGLMGLPRPLMVKGDMSPPYEDPPEL